MTTRLVRTFLECADRVSRGTAPVGIALSSGYLSALLYFAVMALTVLCFRITVGVVTGTASIRATLVIVLLFFTSSNTRFSVVLFILSMPLAATVLVGTRSLIASISEICFITRVSNKLYVFLLPDAFLLDMVYSLYDSLVNSGWAGYCSPVVFLRELFYYFFQRVSGLCLIRRRLWVQT